MKYLIKVEMASDAGGMAVRDPKFGERMQSVLKELRAEAAYFTMAKGHRGGYIIVNTDDSSKDDASEMIAMAKPFLLWLNADVEFIPVMLPQDLVNRNSSWLLPSGTGGNLLLRTEAGWKN